MASSTSNPTGGPHGRRLRCERVDPTGGGGRERRLQRHKRWSGREGIPSTTTPSSTTTTTTGQMMVLWNQNGWGCFEEPGCTPGHPRNDSVRYQMYVWRKVPEQQSSQQSRSKITHMPRDCSTIAIGTTTTTSSCQCHHQPHIIQGFFRKVQ